MKSLTNFFVYRELLFYLTKRHVKASFKQSALGIVWIILKPVTTVIILTVVFSRFAKFPSDGMPYPLFSYGALLTWTLFTSSLGAGVPSLVANANLVTKVYFPREILPLSAILSASLDAIVSAVVFIGLLFFYNIRITFVAFYIIPIILIELIFAYGVVLFLATINVWYRDVGQATGLILQLWMYLTPIIYPLSMVSAKIRPFYVLNPMVGIVEGFRTAVLKGTKPDMYLLGISAVIAVSTFIIGYSLFKAKELDFADVI